MASEPEQLRGNAPEPTEESGEIAGASSRPLLCAPEDPLDRELDQMAELVIRGIELPEHPIEARRRFRRDVVDEGRAMAIAAYFSVLFGVPVFLVPLLMRSNEFALHHARSAGAIYLVCTGMLALATVNCAVFLPLAFVCYIPALIGVYRASAGVEAGTSAMGPLGHKVFGWIEVRE